MAQTPRMSFRKKLALVAVATAALTVGATAPALAEGAFTSSVSGGTAASGGGFSSRWWTDNNRDSAATRTQFSSCYVRQLAYPAHSIQQILFRDNGIFPDHNHGARINGCNNTWASWSRMTAAGSYRWALGEVRVYSGSSLAWASGYQVGIPSLRQEY